MGFQCQSQKCWQCRACRGSVGRVSQGSGGLVANVQTYFELFWPFTTRFYIICTEFLGYEAGTKVPKKWEKSQPPAFQYPSVLHPIIIIQDS